MKNIQDLSNIEVEFKDISARIKQLRVNERYSQEALSEILGYSSSYLYQIEAGLRKLSVTSLVRIALFFNVSLDYLITGKEKDAEDDKLGTLIKTFSAEQRDNIYTAITSITDPLNK